MKKFLIKSGCRNSPLSMVQTRNVLNKIEEDFAGITFEMIGLKTLGDKDKTLVLDDKNTPLDLFTKELDEGVLRGDYEIAIHSAKDLPPQLHAELDFFWLPWQEVPGDVLVLRKGETIDTLKPKPVAGVSSGRRSEYVVDKFPGAILKPIRGTIEERIEQLDKGDFDILLMAEAALNRLHMQDRISYRIPLHELPPPEGQGKIAVTFRKGSFVGLLLRNTYTTPLTFVGAGLGDPDLLTVKAQRAIQEADCVLYDALIDSQILDLANENCQKIFVGKRAGEHSMQQERITALMLQKVKEGKKVVRLKGGDPSIFGRLAEEVHSLESQGLPYRIIPGISALTSVTQKAGVLLTSRDVNQSFITATATTKELSSQHLQQTAQARCPTLFFMGLKQLTSIVKNYLQAGWSKDTSVMILSDHWGLSLRQGELSNIEQKLVENPIDGPALIAIGDFVKDENLMKPPSAALQGKRVLLPGVKESVQHLGQELDVFGAQSIAWPLVHLVENNDAVMFFEKVSDFELIVLTSPASVKAFFHTLEKSGFALSETVAFATTGPSTAKALLTFGYIASFCPEENFSSLGLIEELKRSTWAGKKVLLPRSQLGGKEIETFLVANGANAKAFVLYENKVRRPEEPLPHFDSILFTSPSGIQHYLECYDKESLKGKCIGCIGKVTEKEALRQNIKVNFVARQNNIKGLVREFVIYQQRNQLKAQLE